MKATDQQIQEWADRYDIKGTITDLRAMFEEARTFVQPTPEPKPSATEPEEIWLQLYGDSRPADKAVYMDDSVTWCWHQVFDSDVRYVRADLAVQQPVQGPTQQSLTDEQCDAIYTALDQWAREFDQYEFGLPSHCGDGIVGGREIIRCAFEANLREKNT